MTEERHLFLRERNRLAAAAILCSTPRSDCSRGQATSASFSMQRAMRRRAGVGFATPLINHFGSKNAIMQALSARVIERMAERFRSLSPAGDAIDRVLVMGRSSRQPSCSSSQRSTRPWSAHWASSVRRRVP